MNNHRLASHSALNAYLIRRIAKGKLKFLPFDAATAPMIQKTRWQIPTTNITTTPIRITVKIAPAMYPINAVIDQFKASLA